MNQTLFYGKLKRIHFVGIGGIGMSGIAEVLFNLGLEVSGSDARESDNTLRLKHLGLDIHIGHSSKNTNKADTVVYSSAINLQTNPEILEAHKNHIPVIPRAQMLAELMRFKHGIAVAGSHGKTTTTSLVAHILKTAHLDPTVVIGGKVNQMGTNAVLGDGDFMVAEADESDGSFMYLSPSIAVLTNIDLEHLDYYKNGIEDIKQIFLDFLNKLPFFGLAVVCTDNKYILEILPKIQKRIIGYGLEENKNIITDFTAHEIIHDGLNIGFMAKKKGKELGFVRMRMVGKHNVNNALAAIAVADELGVSFHKIQNALASFRGIERRFTYIGEAKGVKIIDDYGHHPTEIKAVLGAAKEAYPNNNIKVLFQPHRYSRTKDLEQEFAECFVDAQHVVLTDIYAASEEPIENINSQNLANKIKTHSTCETSYAGNLENSTKFTANLADSGDIIITLGAGSITQSGRQILELL